MLQLDFNIGYNQLIDLGTKYGKQLRIIRLDVEKSRELESYIKRELANHNMYLPSTMKNASYKAMHNATNSPSIIEMSLTETMGSDNDAEDDDVAKTQMEHAVRMPSSGLLDSIPPFPVPAPGEPSWEWRPSDIPNASYAIVRCATQQELNEVKQLLIRKKAEGEKEEETILSTPRIHSNNQQQKPSVLMGNGRILGWNWTPCECTADIPHRVEDKFILLSAGHDDLPLDDVKEDLGQKAKTLPVELEAPAIAIKNVAFKKADQPSPTMAHVGKHSNAHSSVPLFEVPQHISMRQLKVIRTESLPSPTPMIEEQNGVHVD